MNFNPTLVQLEWQARSTYTFWYHKFQSHIGAIRITFCNITFRNTLLYFNPTLVQLESLSDIYLRDNIGFQSHIGAIRIQSWDIMLFQKLLFQSHIGAIRISASRIGKTVVTRFQSHIGAIRIGIHFRIKPISTQHFNPTLVQLE